MPGSDAAAWILLVGAPKASSEPKLSNSYWMAIRSHALKKNIFPFIYNKITHNGACYWRTACYV
jgi:hypothetical protein